MAIKLRFGNIATKTKSGRYTIRRNGKVITKNISAKTVARWKKEANR